MIAGIPGAVAGPVGVTVDLVCRAQPGLDRAVAAAAVAGVAGGRARRRELAQALVARPAVRADGRSPAPRVIGDLLIALREAGATVIWPPACAGCGKELRTMQRRGQDWYCGVCGPRRERCGACGNTRTVTFRDRDEQPRCGQCPPGDGRDPAAVLARMLGIHITVAVAWQRAFAVAWQRACAGDWAAYAAEISRRNPAGERS